MALSETSEIVYERQTKLGLYQVVDRTYSGRPARVLYSGKIRTAQSGIGLDGNPLMLFGYNQRLIELVNDQRPKAVLLIGGGVYTLPMEILDQLTNVQIDVIEPNDQLIDIASRYFGFKSDKRLNIYHDYGQNYLKSSRKKYDLIIVDAYNEDQIPEPMMETGFAKQLGDALKQKALVAVNIISSMKSDSPLKIITENYHQIFKYLKTYPADTPSPEHYFSHNFILVAAQSNFVLKLKYQPINKSL